jgi:murein DD-endopeptidase MepM/ murein hydrolase activator NlpD
MNKGLKDLFRKEIRNNTSLLVFMVTVAMFSAGFNFMPEPEKELPRLCRVKVQPFEMKPAINSFLTFEEEEGDVPLDSDYNIEEEPVTENNTDGIVRIMENIEENISKAVVNDVKEVKSVSEKPEEKPVVKEVTPKKKVEEYKFAKGNVKKSLRKRIDYKVKRGDSLWLLAERFNTSVNDICRINNISPSKALRRNQVLKIDEKRKIVTYKVAPGDTLSGIADRMNVSVANLMRLNDLSNANRIKCGQKLFVVRDGKMMKPLADYRISSRFGKRFHPIYKRYMLHRGVDFAARKGTVIRAADDGIIAFSGWMGKSGKLVKIKHKGMSTIYAHCSKLLVKKGQKVKKGDIIAKVGSTGMSTGAHLHFGVKINRKYVNPLKYF